MRAVMHALGIHEEALFAAIFPMAGGIGLKQGPCGAVTGGIMCLGMASNKYGRPWSEFNTWDTEKMMAAMNAIGEFYDRCEKALGGTITCKEITGMEINTGGKIAEFHETEGFERCCRNCGTIAKMVVETLLSEAT